MKYLKAHLVWGKTLPPPDLVDFRNAEPTDSHVQFNRKVLFKIPLDEKLQELFLDILPELNKNRDIIQNILNDFKLTALFINKSKYMITVHFGIWDK